MMRHAILILLLASVPSLSRAQMIRGWGIEGGASGGYHLMTVTRPPNSPEMPIVVRWGFTAGAFVELLNMPVLSFVVDAAYAQKGRVVTPEEVAESPYHASGLSTGPAGGRPGLDYIHLSMLMKLRAGKAALVPYLLLGPRFNFLVGTRDDPGHVFDHYRKSDIGVSMAAGFEIVPRREPLLSLEMRWSSSFLRVFDAPGLTIRNQFVDLLLEVWM